MKFLPIFLIAFRLSAQPYINQDVYDYFWEGTTSQIYNGGCITLTRQYERFAVGMNPVPQHKEFFQYTNSPSCYQGMLVENRWTWSDVTMNNGTWGQYWNGALQSSGTCVCADKRPQLNREVANYANKLQAGSIGKHSRTAWASTRFWINAVTNGNYHIKVKMHGGWWGAWFPGSSFPGDIEIPPVDAEFDFVDDGVKIRGIQCDENGEVTFWWNPYGGVTLDCTPTVTNNQTRNQHWWYVLEMTIIP